MPWDLTGNATTNPALNFLGTRDNQPLAIRTNQVERMRITTAGFVGIGTQNPGAGLEINNGDLLFKAGALVAQGEDPGDIIFRSASGGQKGRIWSYPLAGAGLFLSSATNAPRLTITAAGFVGVWTSSPQSPLHVEPDTDVPVPNVHTSGPRAAYSFSYGPGLPSNTTESSGAQWSWSPEPGDPLRPTLDPPRARLWSFTDKLIVTSFGQMLLPGRSRFGAGAVQFPEVPIGTLTPRPPFPAPPPSPPQSGELVLGGIRTSIRGFDGAIEDTTKTDGLSLRLGYHWIRTNGHENELWMSFRRLSSAVPGVGWLDRSMLAAVPWYAPSFNVTSDARLKTNVQQVEGALDRLERIRGVTFESAETEAPYALGGVPGQPGIGVVAQEVEEVFPEVVSIYDAEDEYKAVDYNGLTSVLIEAVKELKAQNEALRSRIEALERV